MTSTDGDGTLWRCHPRFARAASFRAAGDGRSTREAEVSRDRQAPGAGGAADRRTPNKVPLTARLLLRESLTARRAAGIIAAFTVLITVAGGILERVIDRDEFPTIGRGLWFGLQTVTTVGYGDVTPRQTDGRLIGAIVMLAWIGFLAVITASVTAPLVESSRRRYVAQAEEAEARRLTEISERLARVEAALGQLASGRARDGIN